jgi:lipopolysaccharide transport system permease protein
MVIFKDFNLRALRSRLEKDVLFLYDLLRELVARDVKLRYRDSVLGVAWSLLNPLAQLLVFSFVFRFVLPLNIPNYTSFLFIGLLAWNWFQGSLMAAATAIVDGRSLIRRPGFPAVILPVVSVMANMVHFLLALPIVLVSLWLTGVHLQRTVFLLPLIIILQALFTLSLAYIVATVHVSFRDTQHLIGVFLLLFFYLTPIFYDASLIPARFQPVYRLNPFLHLVEAYRNVLLDGTWPAWDGLAWLTLGTAILLIVGINLFHNASYRFVEEL